MHRERMSTLIEESDDEIDDNMPNLSIIGKVSIEIYEKNLVSTLSIL